MSTDDAGKPAIAAAEVLAAARDSESSAAGERLVSQREVTGKELLAAAAQAVGEVDPAIAAQLAKWFELPSFAQLAQPEANDTPKRTSITDEVRKRQEEASAHADPALVARLWSKLDNVAQLEFSTTAADTMASRYNDFDGAGKFAKLASQASDDFVREVEIPNELIDDLRINTPQALLRDLHRPEEYYPKNFELDLVRKPVEESKEPIASFFSKPAGAVFVSSRTVFAAAAHDRVAARAFDWKSLAKASSEVSDGGAK